jgi:hypothetical protein
LNRAVEIKRALAEHDDPKLILDMIEGETDLAEMCAPSRGVPRGRDPGRA